LISGEITVDFLMADLDIDFKFTVDFHQLDLPNTHVPSHQVIEQAVYKLMRNTSHDIEDIELNLTVDEDEGEL
jgi:hypothetical protein